MTTTDLHPPDRRFWVTSDMIPLDRHGLPEPNFTVHETAKLFFGKSSSWLRLRMRRTDDYPASWLVLDGVPMEIRRKDPDDPGSARLFVLSDIEPMARSMHAFAADEITAERKALQASQPAELTRLRDSQRQIAGKHAEGTKQRTRLTAAHANQRDRLAERHQHQLDALDKRREDLDRQLAATVEIVKGVARLYGILPS